jgi:hypothetical protein
MVVAFIAGSTTIEAQIAEPVGVQQGTRVRVAAAGRPSVIGSFAGSTPDSVRLVDHQGFVRSVSTAEVRSVDVSVGSPVRSGRVAKGTLAGAAVVGAVTFLSIAGDNSGDAVFAGAILAPVGGLVGGIWAAMTAPEQWESVATASLTAAPLVARAPVRKVQPAKGSGKRIAIGALIGGAAGAAFVQTQRSSSPKTGQYLVTVVPGMLVGGAIGALWH